MARLDILEYPDPRLRQSCAPVKVFDGGLRGLADDLIETLHASGAIGLSAPQVGELIAVLVLDLSGDASAPEVYINPEILSRELLGLVQESCLSVPGTAGNLVRATRVRVRAQDVTGAWFERDLEGMHAVALQHEMDHLVGKLFVDRLSWLGRLRFHATAGASARRRARAA